MKLNIGCGKKYKPGYINIDLYEDLIADRLMDAINLDFEDLSCQEILAIHVIEHLSFFEAIYTLSEFFRVLKPEGQLVVEIPDINKAFQHYVKANEYQKGVILGWIYGLPHKGLQHKFGFPPFLLIEILEKAGFHNISTKHYLNPENIPSIKFECQKRSLNREIDEFHFISHIRKNLLNGGCVNFKDSFLTKEQEDLLTNIFFDMKEFNDTNKKEILLEIIIKTLINSPQIATIVMSEISVTGYLSKLETKGIFEVIDLLIHLKLPSILLQSLRNSPIIPGSQQLAYSSIESFARVIINKLLQDRDKSFTINKLHELSESSNLFDINFFSFKMIERLSLDFFYIGIKNFYQENYKEACKNFLESIKLYRNDLFYYWNMAKVLTKLNLKDHAITYYNKAKRFVKFNKVKLKDKIIHEIKGELEWVKNKKGTMPAFKPIISIEDFM